MGLILLKGISCILIGTATLWYVIKHPDKDKEGINGDIKIWMGGIGLIIVGVMYLINKML